MTAATVVDTAPTERRTGASLAASSAAVARRTVRKFVRTPQLIVIGTIQNVMFLVIFRYVFGGAIGTRGVPYVDFLVPGFIATGVLFAGTAAASGMAEDVAEGFLDRLRSLPIPRASVLTGRALAETTLMTWNLALTTVFGFAVGFRLHASVGAGLAAFALCVLYGFAFSWLFITIGLAAGNAQAAQGLSMVVFPLTFVSSAYVPTASMPGWMRPIADHQPITPMVNAVRALALGDRATAVLGHTAGYYLPAALIWSAVVTVVFVPIAVALYRRG